MLYNFTACTANSDSSIKSEQAWMGAVPQYSAANTGLREVNYDHS